MTKIISFHGADHKCGVSMLSQCAAERLAAVMPEKKILLVCARQGSCEYACGVRESMDSVRPYLAGKLADPQEMMRRAKWRKNLYIIGGQEDPAAFGEFHPDMTGYLLQSLRAQADIILCDSGCDPDRGLSLGAMLVSDRIFFVATQSENALRRLCSLMPLYSRLGLKKDGLIINRFIKKASYSLSYIAERTGFEPEKILTVRNAEQGETAEIQTKSLNSFSGIGFRRDVDILAAKAAEFGELRMRPGEAAQ